MSEKERVGSPSGPVVAESQQRDGERAHENEQAAGGAPGSAGTPSETDQGGARHGHDSRKYEKQAGSGLGNGIDPHGITLSLVMSLALLSPPTVLAGFGTAQVVAAIYAFGIVVCKWAFAVATRGIDERELVPAFAGAPFLEARFALTIAALASVVALRLAEPPNSPSDRILTVWPGALAVLCAVADGFALRRTPWRALPRMLAAEIRGFRR